MQFSQHTSFTKAMPTNYMDSPQLQWLYKQKGKLKTCLTNHKGSILHPIVPLVSLRDGDAQAYSHHGQKQFQETSHALAKGRYVPGLKI